MMDNWDEVRTAYHVARAGTVSGAAEALGVHHATVIRHVDALESRLGVKLFQRHARGYTPTEAGQDLLRVAGATDEQFSQLAGRIKGQGDDVTGELLVTSLVSIAPVLVPALAEFQRENPGLVVRFLTGVRLFRLEYAEAHVALRAGPAPEEPDNVVQRLSHQQVALFAAPEYVARHGLPSGVDDLAGHFFVGEDAEVPRAPQERWLRGVVPDEAVVFRSADGQVLETAIRSGAGIGFLPVWKGHDMAPLVRISGDPPEFTAPIWLVTHVDLHRSHKVQAFLSFLKKKAPGWT